MHCLISLRSVPSVIHVISKGDRSSPGVDEDDLGWELVEVKIPPAREYT